MDALDRLDLHGALSIDPTWVGLGMQGLRFLGLGFRAELILYIYIYIYIYIYTLEVQGVGFGIVTATAPCLSEYPASPN